MVSRNKDRDFLFLDLSKQNYVFLIIVQVIWGHNLSSKITFN